MRFKLFLLLLLIPILLLGKKSPEQNATGLPYIYWRLIPLEFNIDKKIPNPENDKLLIDFLSKELLDLKDGENLKPIAKRSNKHSHHFLFQQMLKGSPVYEAYFKVNYLHSGEILSLSNGFFNIPQNLSSSQTHPNALDKTAILDKWLSQNPFNREQVVESEAIWLYLEDDLKAVLKVFIDIPEQVYYSEWLIDDNGQSISEKNLNRYQSRAEADATIFFPDPLTSADTFYGGNYVDNNDADHPVLTNELKSVKIDVQFSLGSYSLQSAFLKMQDLSPPNIAPPTPTIPVFNYTREQNEFESVNVYYHIQNFAKHVVSLGFDNLLIDQILVDGNGLNGQDQSIFTPSNPPRINFGEGGVDDAEDADVVVHEYGHYLSNAAAPNTNDGFERLGLDEGLCDFFAASYSKSIKDFRWYDIFTWDGHNEFWAGRSANVSKKYPEDINSGSIHSNGEMLSTAMMLVQEKIGREKSEMLMIQSIYSYYKNMGMQDAGNLVLQADSILFSGAHYCEIFAVLDQFGLCDPELISGCLRKDNQLAMPVLSNKNICPGDSVLLMNEMELNPDYTYTWSPDYNLIYQNQPVPTVFPDSTIEYELNVQTDDGRFNTKPVKVIVESCALEIFNTAAFASGSGSLIVHLPERQSLRPQWIRLIDLSGKVIQKWDIDSGSATWEINSRGVAPGVYILQLRRNNGKYVSEKLLKLE